jgi:hypothetical protein
MKRTVFFSALCAVAFLVSSLVIFRNFSGDKDRRLDRVFFAGSMLMQLVIQFFWQGMVALSCQQIGEFSPNPSCRWNYIEIVVCWRLPVLLPLAFWFGLWLRRAVHHRP